MQGGEGLGSIHVGVYDGEGLVEGIGLMEVGKETKVIKVFGPMLVV